MESLPYTCIQTVQAICRRAPGNLNFPEYLVKEIFHLKAYQYFVTLLHVQIKHGTFRFRGIKIPLFLLLYYK